MTLEVSKIVCPTCGSPDHMHHLVGANVGYWDMKCFNCNSYFNFDELYKHRIAEVIKPKINADRIRSKTDEELATWIDRIQADAYEHGMMETPIVDYPNIYSEWLDWLRQEATNG